MAQLVNKTRKGKEIWLKSRDLIVKVEDRIMINAMAIVKHINHNDRYILKFRFERFFFKAAISATTTR